MLNHPAILQGNADGHALGHLAAAALPLGLHPHGDAFHHALHVGRRNPVVGEGVDADFAVHQGRGHVVLGAELALEVALRLLVEHHRGGVGLHDLGVGDVLVAELVLAHQAEHAVQHGVVAAAGGVLLDDQGILHPEGLAELVSRRVQVGMLVADDGGGEADGMLQDLVAGGEAALGQLGRHHAVPTGHAGVEGLGHGAEVVNHAAGHGAGHA